MGLYRVAVTGTGTAAVVATNDHAWIGTLGIADDRIGNSFVPRKRR